MNRSLLFFLCLTLSLFAIAVAPAAVSAGTIVTNGVVGSTGTGLGSELYILGLSPPGNGTSESGSAYVNSLGVDSTSGDATNDAGTGVKTVAQMTAVGINDTNLAIIFNVNQASGQTLTLHTFSVNGYAADGTPLFTSIYNAGALTLTATGAGTSGYVFDVTGTDSGVSLATFFGTPTNKLGIEVLETDPINNIVNDGPEHFYVTQDVFNHINEVPEPASMTLLGIGFIGMAGYGWRRRRLARAKA